MRIIIGLALIITSFVVGRLVDPTITNIAAAGTVQSSLALATTLISMVIMLMTGIILIHIKDN